MTKRASDGIWKTLSLWYAAAAMKAIGLRLLFAYAVFMGEMRRAIAREQDERRSQDRFLSTLVIAAAIIAAVRLAVRTSVHRVHGF